MNPLERVRAKSPAEGEAAGETLTAHSGATLIAAAALRDRVGAVAIMPERFWRWALLAALTHDAGKIPEGFQIMIGNSALPATWWGERHEVYSLGFVGHLLSGMPAAERLWVAGAVATHHRALAASTAHQGKDPLLALYDHEDPAELAARFAPVDDKVATAFLEWLAATAHAHDLLPTPLAAQVTHEELSRQAWRVLEELRERWDQPFRTDQLDDGLTAVLLQGAVTLADHLSSAHGELLDAQPVDERYRGRLEQRLANAGHDLWPHQRQCARTQTHLALRAPTGSGKTEAALLWAAEQLQDLTAATGGRPRVFYLLPYLASINAMHGRLTDDLATDDIGVAHSRSASHYLTRALADECATLDLGGETADMAVGQAKRRAADKAIARAAATRNFRELVRVGTPYQLLRGALAGPSHSGILIDAANSVFVLDELHAYEPRRLGMILAMLRLVERLGGRVAVLSATLPNALLDLLRDTLTSPVTLVEPDHAPKARHRLAVNPDHLTAPSTIARITDALHARQAVLVVANNVADAKDLFAALQPIAREIHGEDDKTAALLLHSRFRRMDRARIENALLGRYRVGLPQRQGGLLVATQTVEVSLDVDFDLSHTSGATLDALLQRFGRVNRVAARPPAPVIVHEARYAKRRNNTAALYADGVYPAEPTQLAWNILARHHDAVVDERDVTGWLDEIHASAWGAQWTNDVVRERDDFTAHYLSFHQPYHDLGDLAAVFDKMFNGQEAVLADDLPAYTRALKSATRRAGRLLADEFLVPLPQFTPIRPRWAPGASVLTIDADYDSTTGLGALRGPDAPAYVPGEIL